MSKACMYLRLSRDDGDNLESNSIGNQRELIRAYAEREEITILKEFVDDGVSGATFNRNSFKRMMKALERKEYDTVIVKDLSRFGRDYIESGRYLQKVFPELGVRFISVNDNYDSDTSNMSDTHLILPIKNFINDSYCRDISTKVRSSQKTKRENGEFIGAFAPFGYKKDPKDKHKLLVDRKVSPIIVEIFHMKVMGYSSRAIARSLNERGKVTPLKHKENTGSSFQSGFNSKETKWDAKMVNRIITNGVYIGNLEQGKRKKLNYKSELEIKVLKEDWIVIENTHEPIVSETVFTLANKILKRDVANFKSEPAFFSGMLFCMDCKEPMVRRRYKVKDGYRISYICSSYNKKKGACTRHSIKETDLKVIIDELIRERIELHETLYEKINKMNIDDIKLNVEFDDLEREKSKYEMMRKTLYMDLEDGLIDEDEFESFRKIYLLKIKEVDREIAAKKEYAANLKEELKNKRDWLDDLKTSREIPELSRELLVTLVDKIEIGENNEIRVIFNDIDEVNYLESIIEKNTAGKVKKNSGIISFSAGTARMIEQDLGGVMYGTN
ncbi:MAG: recombinase family protein [Christensenellales bacterium]|jgi:site-specific DNA recombinase